MKPSSCSFALPLVLALAPTADQAQECDVQDSYNALGDACASSLAEPLCAKRPASDKTGRFLPTVTVSAAFPYAGGLPKITYFSVDKRHRPAWWRSARPERRGDENG